MTRWSEVDDIQRKSVLIIKKSLSSVPGQMLRDRNRYTYLFKIFLYLLVTRREKIYALRGGF